MSRFVHGEQYFLTNVLNVRAMMEATEGADDEGSDLLKQGIKSPPVPVLSEIHEPPRAHAQVVFHALTN
jgi:hypothetical protein